MICLVVMAKNFWPRPQVQKLLDSFKVGSDWMGFPSAQIF